MKTPGAWKLYDDGDSALDNGTPFRVGYFVGDTERHLYFATKEEAFAWVQNHPTAERPVIKDLAQFETLFPKETDLRK